MKIVNNSQLTFLAKGRIKSTIDHPLFTEKSPKDDKESILFFLPNNMEDNLRVRSNTYWRFDGKVTFDTAKFGYLPPIKFKVFDDTYRQENKNNIFGKYVQNFTIIPEEKYFKIRSAIPFLEGTTYNSQAWRRYIKATVGPVIPVVDTNNDDGFERRNPDVFRLDSLRNFRNIPTNSPLGSFLEENLDRSNVDPVLPTEPGSPPTIPEKLPNDVFKFEPTIQESETYFDHVFELGLPFNKAQQEKFLTPVGSSFVDVQPVYNFFIRNYEQQINDSIISESLLPNLYSFVTELRQENTDNKNTIFKQHITLNGSLENIFIDLLNSRGEKIAENDKGQYFEKYANKIKNFAINNTDLSNKFNTQIMSLTDTDFFNEFNSRSELFPMYFDIQFTTDQSTEIAQLLEDSKLSTVLLKDIIDNNIPSEVYEASCAQTDAFLNVNLTLKNTSDIKTKSIKYWDLTKWIKDLSSSPIEAFSPIQNGTVLGTYNDEVLLAQSPQYNLNKNLYVILFINKLKSLIDKRTRTFDKIVEGVLAPSETLFYRIEKINTGTGQILQSFWLPNSNDIEIFRFIDTQVKYNKLYTYKIYAYQFVIGNQYSYNLLNIYDKSADVQIESEPSLRLVEVLFHEFTGRIMDSPPMHPDITIIPYKSINNQLLFQFQNMTGELKLKPIIIEPSDIEVINQLREAQKVDEEDFLTYKADDPAMAFEVFRLDKKPSSWRDFEGRRSALVLTDISPTTSQQQADSAAFIDNIIPNKKYFYTFRTIDNHGHISNPSAIYQIILYDNDGAIFPDIRIVDFDKQKEQKSTTKNVKRFIRLSPALNQIIVNEQKSGLIENGERVDSAFGKRNISLGLAEETVWKRRFKIRLTSKNTGRKIDINVSFKNLFREDI